MVDDGSPMSITLIKLNILNKSTRLWRRVWWNFFPGPIVQLSWPRGWTKINSLGIQYESSDPNVHWRPWLEANIGRQGWDWDWRINFRDINSIHLKVHKKHSNTLSLFLLKYGS